MALAMPLFSPNTYYVYLIYLFQSDLRLKQDVNGQLKVKGPAQEPNSGNVVALGEHTRFRLAAQCLNHKATTAPSYLY